MKFLLVAINAKYIHSNLAVYSLKAYAEQYGKYDNCIEIAEYTINQYTDEIVRDIFERKPDAIGFSCYLWNIRMILDVISDYKKICPDTPVWVGGPEVSFRVKEVLERNPLIDYVMYGEGEETFKNVMDAYGEYFPEICAGNDFPIHRGAAYRKKDEIIVLPPEPPVDLSSIPFVYRDLKSFENRIIYYETSRGCPFSCSYCLSSVDKTMRFRTLSLVKKELKFFLEHHTRQVKFVDRTFNCRHDHAMEIWRFIKENDNGITNFHFEIAADLMTEDEIALIRTMRKGLIQLEIGVQSTNEKTLAAIHRTTNLAKISEVVSQIQRGENVHQHLDLIAGLPFETYESFINSFNQVYAMKPDQLQLGFLKVLHGAEMEESARQYRIVYSSRAPYEVLSTEWISYGELLRLKAVENAVEIYYNSFQFSGTVRMLEAMFESPFHMYERLGFYYKEQSPQGEKHSRVANYEMLLEFIKKTLQEKTSEAGREYPPEQRRWNDNAIPPEQRIGKYRESLTRDFYLRENAKTRPAFAKDLSAYREKIRQFYKREEMRSVLPDYAQYDARQVEKMTHIEVFGMENGLPTYILFDYKNRNPLNRQARTVEVTKWIK